MTTDNLTQEEQDAANRLCQLAAEGYRTGLFPTIDAAVSAILQAMKDEGRKQ